MKVEVSLRVPGLTITATDKDYNQTRALDSAIEKAKTQIKKLKSKVADDSVAALQAVVETENTEDSEDFEP